MDNFDSFNKIKDSILPEYKDETELGNKLLLGSCLFGTVLSDAYKKNQSGEIYDALKKLCGRCDIRPFDTYGIYCYWDFETKEILYIGLTKDLIVRFSQHNNLRSNKKRGNKNLKIKDYFSNNEKLGFSLLLQPSIVRNGINLFDKDREIKVIEGALFQSFLNQNGRLPQWNEVEGYKVGRKSELVNRYGDILEMLNLKTPGYLNAKSTIRELAGNVEYQRLECDLNLVRSHMYQWKEPFEAVLAKLINGNNFIASKGNILGIYSNIRLMKLLNHPYLEKTINIL